MALIEVEAAKSADSRWAYAKTRLSGLACYNVPVNSKTAHPPPLRATPGHLTRIKLRTVGNLTQNGAFDFRVKTSVSGRKQKIFVILCVSRAHRSSIPTWVFLLLSVYIVISWNIPLFKVWSVDKLSKKFVMAENFAEFVSKGRRCCLIFVISWVTCLEGGEFDPLWSSNGWGIWPSKLAT